MEEERRELSTRALSFQSFFGGGDRKDKRGAEDDREGCRKRQPVAGPGLDCDRARGPGTRPDIPPAIPLLNSLRDNGSHLALPGIWFLFGALPSFLPVLFLSPGRGLWMRFICFHPQDLVTLKSMGW